jgi:hypothetical protein
LAWEVDDIDATVAQLRARGVVFEEYDLPGLTTVNGIAEVAGNYPSRGGVGQKAACCAHEFTPHQISDHALILSTSHK